MKLLFKLDIDKRNDLSKPQSIIAYYNGKINGKRTKPQKPTPHKVLAKHFIKGEVSGTYEKHEINASLNKLRSIFHQEVVKAKVKGLEIDKSILVRSIMLAEGMDVEIPDVVYLDDYTRTFISEMRFMQNNKGSAGLADSTKRQYINWNNLLLQYQKEREETGGARISLKHATIQDLNDYVKFLIDREYASATISKRIKNLKTIAGHAKKKGLVVSPAFNDVENGFSQKKDKEDIIFLSKDEVIKIKTPNDDLPDHLKNTQTIVAFSLAIGQRVSDMMRITPKSFRLDDDGDYIAEIKQEKTGKQVSIPIKDKALVKVIKEAKSNGEPLFRVISDQKYNDYIKALAQRQGIVSKIKGKQRIPTKYGYRLTEVEGEKYKFISSHTFRRTLISLLYQANVPEYHILKISGHSDTSTLHAYIGDDPMRTKQQTQELKNMLPDTY
ncbi:MAG: tyrosine-type recombinase/integrase [Methylophagaceae bacterium]